MERHPQSFTLLQKIDIQPQRSAAVLSIKRAII